MPDFNSTAPQLLLHLSLLHKSNLHKLNKMLFNAAITTGRTVIFNGFKCLPNITTRKILLSNVHRFNTTFSKVKSLKGEEIEAFKSMLPMLIKELTFEGRYKNMPNVNEHLSKVNIHCNSKSIVKSP